MRESIWQKLTGLTEYVLEEEEEGEEEEEEEEEEEGEEVRSPSLGSVNKESRLNKKVNLEYPSPSEGRSTEYEVRSEEKEEGKLSVDVCEEKDAFIVRATLAGAEPEDIDITVNLDMVTIRARREPEVNQGKYLSQECYWGKFSRTIILPSEIDTRRTKANLKNGILTIILPKLKNQP